MPGCTGFFAVAFITREPKTCHHESQEAQLHSVLRARRPILLGARRRRLFGHRRLSLLGRLGWFLLAASLAVPLVDPVYADGDIRAPAQRSLDQGFASLFQCFLSDENSPLKRFVIKCKRERWNKPRRSRSKMEIQCTAVAAAPPLRLHHRCGCAAPMCGKAVPFRPRSLLMNRGYASPSTP